MTTYYYNSIQDGYSSQQSYSEVNQFTNFLIAKQSPIVTLDFGIRDSGLTQEAADYISTTIFTRQTETHSDIVSIGIIDSRISYTYNYLIDSTVSQFWVSQLDIPVGIYPGSFRITSAWVYYKARCPCCSPSSSYQ